MDRVFGGYGVTSVGFGFLMASLAFLRGILPKDLIDAMWDYVLWLTSLYVHIHIYAEGFDNQLYSAIESYLGSLLWERHILSINVSLAKNASQESYELPNKERIADTFQGVTFWWIHYTSNRRKESSSDKNWMDEYSSSSNTNDHYTLRFHRKHKHTVVPQYLKHIKEHGKQMQHSKRDKFIYTNCPKDPYEWPYKRWKRAPFKHPATFDSMAMEVKEKTKLMNDLKKFLSAKDSYKLAGRAWKRGYLLYGPPGTGKSSLIAAIANFVGYDVYDLELTEVKSNGELRRLLMDIGNKSVIVIEDIDCSIELKNRGTPAPEVKEESAKGEDKKKEKPRVTLSGLLNFTDGLWSSCGSERIIIFTTNHVDQLDPALLRAGRMDVKLELSYATFGAFKVLARTYLQITEHELFDDIQTLISQEDVQITPADVAEVLVQNGGEDNPEAALQGLIVALQGPAHKKKTTAENAEAEAAYLSLS